MNHKLKKQLLATTCLTAISVGATQAAIINESSVTGQDFSNSLSTATMLPSNTTQVNGGIPSNDGDFADYFQVGGFAPGTNVTVSLNNATGNTQTFFVYTSLDPDAVRTPIYNAEGNAVVSVNSLGLVAFGADTEGSQGTYSIFIDAPPPANVPVPASAALLGIGAAAAVGLRRRKHGEKK